MVHSRLAKYIIDRMQKKRESIRQHTSGHTNPIFILPVLDYHGTSSEFLADSSVPLASGSACIISGDSVIPGLVLDGWVPFKIEAMIALVLFLVVIWVATTQVYRVPHEGLSRCQCRSWKLKV